MACGRSKYAQNRYFRNLQRNAQRALDRATTMAFANEVNDLLISLSEVCEYRSRKPMYSVAVLLAVVLIGFLCGENTIKNIETFIKNNPDTVNMYLKEAGQYIKDMPSDSTILRALHDIDCLDLLAVINEWSYRHFQKGHRHIAVDGKAIRACLKKCFGGTHPPYILNAFDVESGAIHAQIQVGDKTNEMGELFNLLDLMNLDGAYITVDAAFSNAAAMRAVLNAGGHMILALKGNQPNLTEAVKAFMQDAQSNTDFVQYWEDSDNGNALHGRICNRRYALVHACVDDLLKDTDFEGVAHSIGMVERYRKVIRYDENGQKCIHQDIEVQTVYYIMDESDISVEEFARYVRNHWAGSEIIHYTLDVEFDEDMSRVIKGNGMQNLSLLRKAAISILADIKKKTKGMSFHDLRQDIRDLGGIPYDHVLVFESTDDECSKTG